MNRICFPLIFTAALSGCIETSAVRMGGNMARIDVSTVPLYAGDSPANVALKLAAKETLAAGFTHFIVVDTASQFRADVIGVIPGQSALGGNYGPYYGQFYGQARGPQPIVQARNERAMVIQMLKASDPRAAGAYNAAALLAAPRAK
jgi:hypothetical protein